MIVHVELGFCVSSVSSGLEGTKTNKRLKMTKDATKMAQATQRERLENQTRKEKMPPSEARQSRQGRTRPSSAIKDPVRYKTALCKNWQESGHCPYGPRCQFAHGDHEVRARVQCAAAVAVVEAAAPPLPWHPVPSPSPPVLKYENSDRASTGPDCSVASKQPLKCPVDTVASGQTMVRRPFVASEQPHHAHPVEEVASKLHVDARGEVVCQRNASYNTLSLRRQLSSLWDITEPFFDRDLQELGLPGELPLFSDSSAPLVWRQGRQPLHSALSIQEQLALVS